MGVSRPNELGRKNDLQRKQIPLNAVLGSQKNTGEPLLQGLTMYTHMRTSTLRNVCTKLFSSSDVSLIPIQECTGAGHMLQISDEDVNRVRTFGVTPANKYSLPPPALSLPVPPSFLPIPLPSPTFRLKSSISRMHICADAQNTRLHVHTLKRMHTHKTRARTHALALAHTGGGAQANVQMYTKEGFVDYAATNSNKQIDPEAMANAIARYLVCARVRKSACLRARAHFEVREYLRCTSMQVGT